MHQIFQQKRELNKSLKGVRYMKFQRRLRRVVALQPAA